jgi:hypothetical protein
MKPSKPNGQPEDDGLGAPPRLQAAFRHLPKERIFVPPTLDEAVLGEARRHLPKRVRRRFDWSLLRPWLPAAAAIMFLGLLAYLFIGTSFRGPRQPLFVREDLNHDGRVDILDAFALARALKAGAALDRRLDINGDGVVNERDVATIAAHAVTVQKGGHS